MLRRVMNACVLWVALSACSVLAQAPPLPSTTPTPVVLSNTPTPTAAPAPRLVTPPVETTSTQAPDKPGVKPSSTASQNDTRFNLNATQAELVYTVVSFVQAYNNGRVEEALALLDDKITGSDCDYTRVTTVFFKGKPEAEAWLRERKADADQLTVERILNENPGETHVAGVTFARRTSNTLRSLGFAQGIQPKLVAKVVVYYQPTRIIAFANGPGGGDQRFCRPE